MREKLNSEIIDRVIYEIGLALRDNVSSDPHVEVEVAGLKSRYINNYVTISSSDQISLNVSFHVTDLPKQHQEFLRKALALWFINVDEGFLVETKEVIEA